MVLASSLALKACRSCLITTGKLERITDITRRVFYTICGLEVTPEDGLPQYLCPECSAFVRKALTFRRKTRRAYYVLNEIKKTNEKKADGANKGLTTRDIQKVNRVASNLMSSRCYWNPENSAEYYIKVPDPEEEQNLDPHIAAEVEKAKLESVKILNYELDDKVKDIPQDTPFKVPPVVKSKCLIVVDIKPDNYKEIEKLERQKEEEEALRQIRDEDSHFDDNPTENPVDDDGIDPATIDLNDVFKDLPQNEIEDSDDSLSEQEIPIRKRKKYYYGLKDLKIEESTSGRKLAIDAKSMNINISKNDMVTAAKAQNVQILDILAEVDIRYLNIEEQKQVFAKRQQSADYKRARFRCAMCLISVNSKEELIQHSKEFHLHKTVKCGICESGFEDQIMLEIHNAWQHWYKYTCICGTIHYTFKELVSCAGRHEKLEDVLNEEQLKEYRKKQKLHLQNNFVRQSIHPQKWHLTVKKTDTYRCVCPRCGEDYPTFKLRVLCEQRHKTMETAQEEERDVNPGPFQCDVCSARFYSKDAVRNHIERIHLYEYSCKMCPRNSAYNRFTRTEALSHRCTKFSYLNYQLHYKPSEHYCAECGRYYNTRAGLISHQLANHYMIRLSIPELCDPELTCHICYMQFSNVWALQHHKIISRHMRQSACKDDQQTKYPVKCTHCDVMVCNGVARGKHMMKYHPNFYQRKTEVLVCEKCGAQSYSLTKHLLRCAYGGGSLQCKHCPYTANTAKIWLKHTLRNHIDKPYCCTVCGQRYNENCKCKQHILKCHVPEKPFQCELCQIKFSSDVYCRQHMKKVHGITPAVDKQKRRAANRQFRKHIVIYPHMKIVATDVPTEILMKSKINLMDYLDENLTPIPKDKIMDYFLTDVYDTCDVEEKVKKKRNKKKKKSPQKELKVEGKEENEESIEQDEYVVSFVKNQYGGFTKKSDIIETALKNIDPSGNPSNDYIATDIEEKNEVDQKDDNKNSIHIEPYDDVIEEVVETKPSEIIEEFPVEDNPIRIEIDADELALNYEVILVDGVQYANIDGVLYKVEYS